MEQNPPPGGSDSISIFGFRVRRPSWVRRSGVAADPANLTPEQIQKHVKSEKGQNVIVDGDAIRRPGGGNNPGLRIEQTVIEGDD